jgi:hypothetical protein
MQALDFLQQLVYINRVGFRKNARIGVYAELWVYRFHRQYSNQNNATGTSGGGGL